MREVVVVILVTVALVACGRGATKAGGTVKAGPSPATVRVVRQAELVKDCEFLASVEGNSNWGGTMMSKKGLENAREEAREKAAEKGADMLLLQTEDAGATGSTVTGDAYRCKKPEADPSQSTTSTTNPEQTPAES